ncbi:MAG: CFI-box-CTERM domain-containing protein [Chitinophagaceae bacterium]
MNRRIFLHKSSLAAIAAASLPKAVIDENTASRYKTELKDGLPGQWYYEIGLYHSTVEDFDLATEEEKVLGLKVQFYETADHTKPSKTGEYKYIITSCEEVEDTEDIWKITTKLDKKIAGNHKFSKEYPKNLSFQCKTHSYINILDKKGGILTSVPYPAKSFDDSDDCFLTTACVRYKGLPDDCEELQTLRQLRDEYMSRSEEGRSLINQYSITGPEIVQAIGACRNKKEIYQYMHDHMILPSLELIRQSKYEEAKEYYKTFVKGLKEIYC